MLVWTRQETARAGEARATIRLEIRPVLAHGKRNQRHADNQPDPRAKKKAGQIEASSKIRGGGEDSRWILFRALKRERFRCHDAVLDRFLLLPHVAFGELNGRVEF